MIDGAECVVIGLAFVVAANLDTENAMSKSKWLKRDLLGYCLFGKHFPSRFQDHNLHPA